MILLLAAAGWLTAATAPQASCATGPGMWLRWPDAAVHLTAEHVQLSQSDSETHEDSTASSGPVTAVFENSATRVAVVLGDTWRIELDGESADVRPPSPIRGRSDARVLGGTDSIIWIGSPGIIAWAMLPARGEPLSETVVRVQRVGSSKDQLVPLKADERLLVFAGPKLLECDRPLACRERARLPIVTDGVVAGPGGWVIAARGKAAGLYRLGSVGEPVPQLLVGGEVETFCAGDDGLAWALVRRAGEARVIVASATTPAVRPLLPYMLLADAVVDAPGPIAASLLTRLLLEARAGNWRVLESLALLAARDERKQVRILGASALAGLESSRAVAAWWRLAHDSQIDVRWAALEAAENACGEEGVGVCRRQLAVLLDDPDNDLRWRARDALLLLDPAEALADAPREYKIGILSRLTASVEGGQGRFARLALELLMADPDPDVRDRAHMIAGNLTL